VVCARRMVCGPVRVKYCSNACRSAHGRQRPRIRRHFAHKPRCTTCRKLLPLALRTDAHFCSAACRQAAYRSRKATRPQKAHQRRVKDGLANDGAAHGLDIRRAEVRPITSADAKALIAPFELLRAMPAVVRYAFGIFFDGRLAGAVVYGDEAAANLRVWERFGFGGQIIALHRGACLPWAHPHSASKLIRRSMALLPFRYKVITATVDGTV